MPYVSVWKVNSGIKIDVLMLGCCNDKVINDGSKYCALRDGTHDYAFCRGVPPSPKVYSLSALL